MISDFTCVLDDIEIEPLIEPSSGTDGDSEPVYGNIGLCTIVPVKVEDLWDYVKANKINEAEGLKREYRVSGQPKNDNEIKQDSCTLRVPEVDFVIF